MSKEEYEERKDTLSIVINSSVISLKESSSSRRFINFSNNGFLFLFPVSCLEHRCNYLLCQNNSDRYLSCLEGCQADFHGIGMNALFC